MGRCARLRHLGPNATLPQRRGELLLRQRPARRALQLPPRTAERVDATLVFQRAIDAPGRIPQGERDRRPRVLVRERHPGGSLRNTRGENAAFTTRSGIAPASWSWTPSRNGAAARWKSFLNCCHSCATKMAARDPGCGVRRGRSMARAVTPRIQVMVVVATFGTFASRVGAGCGTNGWVIPRGAMRPAGPRRRTVLILPDPLVAKAPSG